MQAGRPSETLRNDRFAKSRRDSSNLARRRRARCQGSNGKRLTPVAEPCVEVPVVVAAPVEVVPAVVRALVPVALADVEPATVGAETSPPTMFVPLVSVIAPPEPITVPGNVAVLPVTMLNAVVADTETAAVEVMSVVTGAEAVDVVVACARASALAKKAAAESTAAKAKRGRMDAPPARNLAPRRGARITARCSTMAQ
jgi:hypothetical protein